MTPLDIPAYVKAALVLQGYSFNEHQTAAITHEFEHIASIAQILIHQSLPFELDAAPVFRP